MVHSNNKSLCVTIIIQLTVTLSQTEIRNNTSLVLFNSSGNIIYIIYYVFESEKDIIEI